MSKIAFPLTLILLFVFQYSSAQNIDEMLHRYGTNEKEATMEEIQYYYRAADDNTRLEILQSVVSQIEKDLTSENKQEALSFIALYQLLADSSNAMLPTLYYIAGDIYANHQDSVGLKRSIANLEKFSERLDVSLTDYLSPLNDYLARIRSMSPSLRSLEGYWVSSWISSKGTSAGRGMPYMILHIRYYNEDSVEVELMKYSQVVDSLSHFLAWAWSDLYTAKPQYSQIVLPFSKDSLYMLWSTQKITNKSDFAVSMLRSATSEIASSFTAKYSQRNKYSIEERFAGQMMTGLVEMGVNALLDEIFMPKRKDYVLEARLCVKNSHVMKGVIDYSTSKQRGDGESERKDNRFEMTFLRWDSLSQVAFVNPQRNPILPSEADSKSFRKNKETDFYNSFSQPKSHSDNYRYLFNRLQLLRLCGYNDSVLRASGISHTELFDENCTMVGFMGVRVIDNTKEVRRKYFLHTNRGVMVSEILKGWPAYFSSLHRGDVITHVNGRPINSAEEFYKLRYYLLQPVKLTVKRSRREKEVVIWPVVVQK